MLIVALEERTRSVRKLLLKQHGLITRAQILATGSPPNWIDRQIASGRWRRVAHGVYASCDVPATPEQLVLTGVLAVGGDALASHASAAWLHGFPGFPKQVEVEVTTSLPRRARVARVHRMRVGNFDRTVVRGIPATRPGRTVVDLAEAKLAPETLKRIVDHLVRSKVARVPLLQRLVRERGTRGRRGLAAFARLLDELGHAYVPTESKLEDLFVDLIEKAGLPEPRRQFALEDERGRIFAEIDFAYERERIAIWLDGVAYHGDVSTWSKDIGQANSAASLGWRSLRFTWAMVTREPERVVATLRSTLEG